MIVKILFYVAEVCALRFTEANELKGIVQTLSLLSRTQGENTILIPLWEEAAFTFFTSTPYVKEGMLLWVLWKLVNV